MLLGLEVNQLIQADRITWLDLPCPFVKVHIVLHSYAGVILQLDAQLGPAWVRARNNCCCKQFSWASNLSSFISSLASNFGEVFVLTAAVVCLVSWTRPSFTDSVRCNWSAHIISGFWLLCSLKKKKALQMAIYTCEPNWILACASLELDIPIIHMHTCIHVSYWLT